MLISSSSIAFSSLRAETSPFLPFNTTEVIMYLGLIEELSDTAAPDTIAFIGSRAQDVVISTQFPGSRVHMLTELIEEDFLFNGEHAYLYLKNTFGMDIPIATSSQQAELIQNPDVVKMSAWPAADSVAVVDGVLVIKLQENP